MKSNTKLAAEVYFGRVEAEHLAVMNSEELASDEARAKALEIMKRASEATMVDWTAINRQKLKEAAGVKTNGFLKCPKCKGNETDYYEKQTRSGDEPMTRCARGALAPPPHPIPPAPPPIS